MSFFFKKGKKRSSTATVDDNNMMVGENNSETDELVQEEAEINDIATADNDGHAAFNNAVVHSLRDTAIEIMETESVFMTQDKEHMAAEIMSRVTFIYFQLIIF